MNIFFGEPAPALRPKHSAFELSVCRRAIVNFTHIGATQAWSFIVSNELLWSARPPGLRPLAPIPPSEDPLPRLSLTHLSGSFQREDFKCFQRRKNRNSLSHKIN